MPKPRKSAEAPVSVNSDQAELSSQQEEVVGWLKVVQLATSLFMGLFRSFK